MFLYLEVVQKYVSRPFISIFVVDPGSCFCIAHFFCSSCIFVDAPAISKRERIFFAIVWTGMCFCACSNLLLTVLIESFQKSSHCWKASRIPPDRKWSLSRLRFAQKITYGSKFLISLVPIISLLFLLFIVSIVSTIVKATHSRSRGDSRDNWYARGIERGI